MLADELSDSNLIPLPSNTLQGALAATNSTVAVEAQQETPNARRHGTSIASEEYGAKEGAIKTWDASAEEDFFF